MWRKAGRVVLDRFVLIVVPAGLLGHAGRMIGIFEGRESGAFILGAWFAFFAVATSAIITMRTEVQRAKERESVLGSAARD